MKESWLSRHDNKALMLGLRDYIKPSVFLVAGLLFVNAALLKASSAQQVGALSVEDALGTQYLDSQSPIEFSPDGKWLAFHIRDERRRKELKEEAARLSGVYGTGSDIWILNTESGETRNLTNGLGENWLPKWSPDGHFLAFLSDRDGAGQARLWVWDMMKNELRKVSESRVRTFQTIEWQIDSQSVFVTVAPQDELSTNEIPKKILFNTEGQASVSGTTQSPTVHLYRSSANGQGKPLESDPWDLNGAFRDLAKIDIATGQTTVVIHGQRIETFKLSPDRSRIAYTVSKRFEKPGSQQELFDIVTVTLSTNHQNVIASDVRLEFDGAEFNWSPDGTLISYVTSGFAQGTIADCYVVNATVGSPRNLTKFPPPSEPQRGLFVPLWDKSGDHVYFVHEGSLWQASVSSETARQIVHIPRHQIGYRLLSQSDGVLWTVDDGRATIVVAKDEVLKQEGFYRVTLASGQSLPLLEKGQCYTCWNLTINPFGVTRDGQRLVYVAEDAEHPRDLWLTGPSFRSPRRLTHLNPQFENQKLGAARLINWLSDDGERLYGALLLPSDYEEGKRYPLIVGVYGGAALSDSFDSFGLTYGAPLLMNMQLLATRGYAVLLPDSPWHEGTPMADLVKTVLPGVNKVIDMGIADPERLGVMGHSNGGYSTLALIVQTKRFKAAIDIDGLGDLVGAYGSMRKDGTAYQTSVLEHSLTGNGMGGTPWQSRERYIENSPFFYLDRVETPVLIVHAAGDPIVASFLADEMFVALRRLGKDVEYAKYDGESHAPPGYANQLDCQDRMLVWFDKYLKSTTH